MPPGPGLTLRAICPVASACRKPARPGALVHSEPRGWGQVSPMPSGAQQATEIWGIHGTAQGALWVTCAGRALSVMSTCPATTGHPEPSDPARPHPGVISGAGEVP